MLLWLSFVTGINICIISNFNESSLHHPLVCSVSMQVTLMAVKPQIAHASKYIIALSSTIIVCYVFIQTILKCYFFANNEKIKHQYMACV